ncbi:hypothetical protein [Algoriphagus winogradskyi]|uniref:Uncharacterized protein n=1 Tax=Algoriphagus winogradskyi TaxID=237017 RepID=A0ABY1NGI4_9BACT|nr:hypothetical protein [Algoriphagus winogradskyi]SMP08230.1 hypothetical protein SAMN06265367_101704 [Algoriphagus winogradskyi]
MKNKKTTTSTQENQVTNAAIDSVKNISELGKTELLRKKKVDPEIE